MKTHINGNTIEQVLTNAVTLTQAQYDALPLEQKNHGTYIISDADAPAISSSTVGYNNSNVKDTLDTIKAITDNITLPSNYLLEVGMYPFTYRNIESSISGFKITNTTNNRYILIGLEMAGGTLGGGCYIYNSWLDYKTRLDFPRLVGLGEITAINGDITIPDNAQKVYVRVNINDYVVSPYFEIFNIGIPHARSSFAYGYNTWLANFEIAVNTTTKKYTWVDERTMVGTKSSSWNVKLQFFALSS